MNLDIIDFTREPDIWGPSGATHIHFGESGHTFWKIEGTLHYRWDGAWVLCWLVEGGGHVNEHS